MAGGIFKGQDFSLNLKCVVITLILAGCYWYLPPKNYYILFFILWITYISIAWYDYIYKCKIRMSPTIFPFGKYIYLPFKDPDYQNEYNNLSEKKIEIMNKINDVFLWSIVLIIIFYYFIFLFFK